MALGTRIARHSARPRPGRPHTAYGSVLDGVKENPSLCAPAACVTAGPNRAAARAVRQPLSRLPRAQIHRCYSVAGWRTRSRRRHGRAASVMERCQGLGALSRPRSRRCKISYRIAAAARPPPATPHAPAAAGRSADRTPFAPDLRVVTAGLRFARQPGRPAYGIPIPAPGHCRCLRRRPHRRSRRRPPVGLRIGRCPCRWSRRR